MPFSHLYGQSNIVGSINTFIKTNLGTGAPTFLNWTYGTVPPRSINFDYPDIPLVFPSFSVSHLSTVERERFQGDRADKGFQGVWRQGIFEVDCWIDSTADTSWRVHLDTMRDMAFKMFEQSRAITLYDYTTPASPTALGAIARIVDIQEQKIFDDPKPEVKRIRITAQYEYMERF